MQRPRGEIKQSTWRKSRCFSWLSAECKGRGERKKKIPRSTELGNLGPKRFIARALGSHRRIFSRGEAVGEVE